jgi:antirestriction protein ArdC
MTKQDVYQEVTDRIIAALEQGVVPWRKPWRTINGTGPLNIRSGRPYRGINVFLLGLAGYSDPRWGTYKAIREAGGNVRKGEKGTHVILWKPVPKKDAAEGEAGSYLLLKQYVVFNAEQCDDIAPYEPGELNEHTPNERAEELTAGYVNGRGPALIHRGDVAAYAPFEDKVFMPIPEAFRSPESYYRTLFHELTHSTGHESRLKRIEPAVFGSDPYAREELVAELGAAMLAGLIGLPEDETDQSAAYIGNWLGRLKDDRKLVVQAAAQAQKAADFIFNPITSDVEERNEQAVAA